MEIVHCLGILLPWSANEQGLQAYRCLPGKLDKVESNKYQRIKKENFNSGKIGLSLNEDLERMKLKTSFYIVLPRQFLIIIQFHNRCLLTN